MEGGDARTLVRLAMKIVLDFMRAKPLYLELIRHRDEVPLAVFLEPMERFWLHRMQHCMMRSAPGSVVPNVQAHVYTQFNSVFFNLLRHASDPTPFVSEDELLDALANGIAWTLAPSPMVATRVAPRT